MKRYPLLYYALSLIPLAPCFANPQDPSVISGSVAFEQVDAAKLKVTAGDKAIIHWKDFSIGAGEITEFIQPNSQATVLNRVMGELPSQILGNLQATGKVFLINPRGVVIGEGAKIDTGYFIASTLDLSDHDFAEKKELLFKGSSEGAILNLGTINAWDGDVLLLAKCVENKGSITAPQGVTVLAAAQEILLKPSGSERVFIHPQIDPSDTIVTTSGEISALQVELKAEGNPYALAIKQSGKVEALSIEEKKGRVFLVAEKGGIDCTGSIACDGSEIKISGNTVTLGGEDGSKSSLLLQSEENSTLSIKAKEELTVHDGFSIFAAGTSLALETTKGDIHLYGSVKIQDSLGAKVHAGRDIRVGSGKQEHHSRFDSHGPITLITGRDLLLTASGTRVAEISTHDTSGSISATIGQDAILMGGKESSARAYIFSKNSLSLVTGRHLKLDSTGEGYAAVGATRDVTVVVDNLFSTPPLVGPGALFMGPNTRMQGESLRIFTVKQSLNTLEGALNLVSFSPGAEFSMSGEEIWGTYFFSSTGGVPFTIFYKDVWVSPRIADLFIIATTEFFQDLKDFDYFFYVQRRFLLGYDRKAFAKIQRDSPRDRSYRMLRKTYKHSCGELRELL